MPELSSQFASGLHGEWLLVVQQMLYKCTSSGRMWIGTVAEWALDVLVPSGGEINVTLVTALLLVVLVSVVQHSFAEENTGEREKSRKKLPSGEFEADVKFNDMQPQSVKPGSNKTKEVSSFRPHRCPSS